VNNFVAKQKILQFAVIVLLRQDFREIMWNGSFGIWAISIDFESDVPKLESIGFLFEFFCSLVQILFYCYLSV